MKKRIPKLMSWLVGAVFLASCGEPGTPTAPVLIPISTDIAMLLSTPPNGPTACRNGSAGGYPCSGVDLVSMLDREAIGAINGNVNDMWGWTDPQTGTEWALVGHSRGTSFVGLSDPEAPLYAGILPLTPGARPSIWRDLKVYRDHVFIVSDAAGQHGMQVFDLRQLRNVASPPVTFEPSFLYRQIHSAHNIVINEETGFAYSVGGSAGGETCGGGLHMIDLSTPLAPRFVGCFADPSTGFAGTGYTHDAMCVIYRGPDARYRGREICFSSNQTGLSIADVSDKSQPVALSVATYPNVGYAHQAWLDDAHQYLYMNDEGDERGPGSRTRTIVWDVTSLGDPIVATEYLATTAATDHNLYIVGDLMYQSNYEAGLRIVSIEDRERPSEIGFFDVEPDPTAREGTWSNFPFFASGVIAVTAFDHGVFFVRVQGR